MKKLVSLLLALCLVLSLAACSKDDSSADNVYGTVTAGVLTVATSPDYAPYEFYAIDENGDPYLAGFDMDLAQYIADYLGLTLEIIPMDFNGTLMELGEKKVDLSMAGYSPDPERLELMDFTDVYYEGGQAFITTQSMKDVFTSLDVANDAQYSVGAQNGSIQAQLAETFTPNADQIVLTNVPDIIQELLNGKIDGAYVETVVAENYAKNYPDLYVAFEVPYEAEGNVIGVSKGNTELLNAVNEALKAAIDDGSFAEYLVKANDLAAGDIIEGLVD